MRIASLVAVIAVALLFVAAPVHAQGKVVTLEKQDGRIVVKIDGQLFTQYIYEGYEKPILHPVIGPNGVRMTRNWPVDDSDPTEAHDHPHHKGIWFGHMSVNGESFWHVGETAGTTVQTKLVSAEGDTIKTEDKLVARDGKKVIATDSRTIRFWAEGDTRFIDYSYTYHATQGDIKFGDDKDGQMGIRMNQQLRVKPNKGQKSTGQAINSAGDTTNDIWGKRADWIDYWGTVDGKAVGIAMFDHPSNFRHPTWWHAREYGLLSANPWGIHHFEKKKEPVGEYTLKSGESLTFRYLFVFHTGDYKSADIAGLYAKWAK